MLKKNCGKKNSCGKISFTKICGKNYIIKFIVFLKSLFL